MSTTEEIKIEEILPWGDPIRVETKVGVRMLRKALPTGEFWDIWRSNKDALRMAGISVGKNYKDPDVWEVCWWQDVSAEERAKLKANLAQSQAVDTDVVIPAPEGLNYFGFQKAGIVFARDKKGILFGDEMGLGKTIQAIGIMNDDPTLKKVMVICPASLKLNWKRELEKWMIHKRPIEVAESVIDPIRLTNYVLIINYDIIWRNEWVINESWDYIVADEGHFIKNPKSKRGKAVMTTKARRKAALTGTPILNVVEEIWPMLNWLDAPQWPSVWKFKYKFAGNLELLQRRLRETIMVRRLKAEVLTDLPAKIRQFIEFPAEGLAAVAIANERKAQESLKQDIEKIEELQAAIELAKASEDPEDHKAAIARMKDFMGSLHISEISRLRHETALAKVPITIEHIKTCIEGGRKVIVFAHHRDCLENIMAAFPGISVLLYGGMSKETKQASVDRFQNDPNCLLFFGSTHAAGVGITLHASSHVIFHEEDWTPAWLSQAEDRSHRIGQQNSVLVQHILLEGSLDVRMAKTNVRKQEICDRALEVDRMIEEQEPVSVADIMDVKKQPDRVTISRTEIRKQAIDFAPDRIIAVHKLLQILAGVCDGAVMRDDHGFNGCDARIGHSLARQASLTARQAVLGAKILRKYHRQLPGELLAKALGEETKL